MKKSRLLSLLASAALAVASLGTGLTAFAATGDVQKESDTHEVTITKQDANTHTYEAYQLFKGTLTEQEGGSKVMTYISWGQNVDTGKLKKLLSGESLTDPEFTAPEIVTDIFDPIADVQSGENLDPGKVADKLNGIANDSELAQALADVFHAALKGDAFSTSDENGKIGKLTTGYYLFKDADTSQENAHGAYTDFILRVVENLTVKAKADVPSIEKNILVGETKKKGDTASIGDEIHYQLDSKVPDMSGYTKYYFVVNDVMSKGLTFDAATGIESIMIGTKTLVAPADYTVTASAGENGATNIKIVFKNFIQYKAQKGDAITIKYKATLNEKCDRTQVGNPNKADLTFSNDPNYKYDDDTDNDEPKEGEPTGKTPPSETKVYTTGIRILKLDQDGKVLPGAKFVISGTSMNKVITVTTKFTASEDGEFYKLKDGTFTKQKPTDDTMDKYDSATVKYAETRTDGAAQTGSGTALTVEATSDENGLVIFSGLGEGTYTIQESEAPKGYNKDENAYTVVIGSDPTFETPGWKVGETKEKLSAAAPADDNDYTVITKKVTNKKGIILPTTGGIGTVLFYVIGSALIAGAGVLFVTKKRKTVKEK